MKRRISRSKTKSVRNRTRGKRLSAKLKSKHMRARRRSSKGRI